MVKSLLTRVEKLETAVLPLPVFLIYQGIIKNGEHDGMKLSEYQTKYPDVEISIANIIDA